MIQSLRVQNFQSHPDTTLNFCPGVNVIVGASDSGKTALLRALGWVVWNRPSGDAFRSSWGGDVSARVVLSSGDTIVRGLDKKGGYYQAGGLELRAFKTEVPEVVQSMLAFDPVNIQSQHDAPFLLSESPGEVARQLNRVAWLDIIDTTLANVTSRTRDATRDARTLETRAAAQEAQLAGLAWVDEAAVEIRRLDDLNALAEYDRNVVWKLQAILQEAQQCETRRATLARRLESSPEVERLIGLERKAKDVRFRAESLTSLTETTRAYSQRKKALEKKAALAGAVGGLEETYQQALRLRKSLTELHGLIRESAIITRDLEATRAKLKAEQEQFKKLMPAACPLCGK